MTIQDLVSTPSLWESIKSFDIKGVMRTISLYPFDWVEIGASGALGVLSGFLLKRYFKIFMMTLLIGVFVITALDYFEFVRIEWDKIFATIGIEPSSKSFDTIYHVALAWIQTNIQGFASFCVGFFLGMKFS